LASIRQALQPISLLAIILLLWLAKPVLVPILMALLLTQLLIPVTNQLERTLPVALADLISLGLVVAVFGCLVMLVTNQLGALSDSLPEIQHRLSNLLSDLTAHVSTYLRINSKNKIVMFNKMFESSLTAGGGVAVTAFAFTLSTIAQIVLTLVLAFLMLFYRRHFQRQLLRLGTNEDWSTFVTVVQRTADLGQRYIAGLVLVIALVGGLDSLGFLLVDAPFPILFGVCGAVAVLIPYVGIFLIAPFCMLLTFANSGANSTVLLVAVVFAVVHFLEGNVISPNIIGRKVNLNPLATIIAVLIGGELWGPVGMLLFIPLAGIMQMTCELTPGLEPFAHALGTVTPADRSPRRGFWHRLKVPRHAR